MSSLTPFFLTSHVGEVAEGIPRAGGQALELSKRPGLPFLAGAEPPDGCALDGCKGLKRGGGEWE